MEAALYGDGGLPGAGFFRAHRPADHFRTSAHTGSTFADALARLLTRVDAALDAPQTVDLVDVGAGSGELLTAIMNSPATEPALRLRLRPVAVEIAERPDGLDPSIAWTDTIPNRITGLLIATEWLDNVPLDVAEDGHYVLVDEQGQESHGAAISVADQAWLGRWWPEGVAIDGRGTRTEIGAPRDEAWAGAVSRLTAGLALAVDYGHFREARPTQGTLTGYRAGREGAPVPDGSCDLTAHLAADSAAAAGSAVAGLPARVVRQSEALSALGVAGRRPGLAMANRDPAAYVRALAAASVAAELTDPAGLGGHVWIEQPVNIRWPA